MWFPRGQARAYGLATTSSLRATCNGNFPTPAMRGGSPPGRDRDEGQGRVSCQRRGSRVHEPKPPNLVILQSTALPQPGAKQRPILFGRPGITQPDSSTRPVLKEQAGRCRGAESCFQLRVAFLQRGLPAGGHEVLAETVEGFLQNVPVVVLRHQHDGGSHAGDHYLDPSKRNSLGNLTAWLRPLVNSFAVFMHVISIDGLYQQAVSGRLGFTTGDPAVRIKGRLYTRHIVDKGTTVYQAHS